MKAAVYYEYGSPEVVKVLEIETPKPGEKEILLKVHAGTVNRTDCGFRSAEYFISRFFSGLFKPKFKVLGCEFAGEVVETGAGVTRFKVGERLFGFNDARFGAHAEYMILKEQEAMARIPDGMGYEEAAALTEGAHYALCDINALGLQAGDRVLVNGATGAIGSAAVQLLKYFGMEVTAVCPTRHVETVKGLGADRVIDYLKEDFTKLKEPFDAVFDAVGKSRFRFCKGILKPDGRYVSTELGPNSENVWLALLAPFMKGKKVLFPLPSTRQQDLDLIKELAETGKFKPLIDRHYDLDKIVDAYRYVETGMKTGNVIIKI